MTGSSTSLQQAIEAKGATWKKVLWWVLGGLALITGVAFVWVLLKKKNPLTTPHVVAEGVKTEVIKIDASAKVEAAKAAGAEDKVVKEIEEAALDRDPVSQAKRLAALAMEDY